MTLACNLPPQMRGVRIPASSGGTTFFSGIVRRKGPSGRVLFFFFPLQVVSERSPAQIPSVVSPLLLPSFRYSADSVFCNNLFFFLVYVYFPLSKRCTWTHEEVLFFLPLKASRIRLEMRFRVMTLMASSL